MRFSRTLAALAAALALTAAPPARSQATLTPPGSTTAIPVVPPPGAAPGIGDIFSGTPSVPLSLKLGDLNGDWRRMTITGTFDLGSVTQVITSLLGSAGVGVYYTHGQTVTLGSTTYLITYRTQPKALDLTSLMQMMQTAAASNKPPAPEPLTANTPLALTLLNLQSAGSLTDVCPFDLNTELTDSANAVKAFNDLMNLMGSLDTTPKPAPRPRPYRPRPKAKKYPTT
ncbi:MAG: hypothetical protein JO250_12875 [Armatimonadetes bacterium]|nr:hypothetical protein [Armatimonadota bacterium]